MYLYKEEELECSENIGKNSTGHGQGLGYEQPLCIRWYEEQYLLKIVLPKFSDGKSESQFRKHKGHILSKGECFQNKKPKIFLDFSKFSHDTLVSHQFAHVIMPSLYRTLYNEA